MVTAEGWVLHLQCDRQEERIAAGDYNCHGEKPFYGAHKRTDAYRHARREGWKVTMKTGAAVCPWCRHIPKAA